jgi:hypothetical protein
MLSVMIFGTHSNFSGGPGLSRVSNILYQSTSRIIWAIGLGYVVYACVTSNGGLINKFLSHSFWIPLARLSFAAYLIHVTLIFTYLNSLERTLHFAKDIDWVKYIIFTFHFYQKLNYFLNEKKAYLFAGNMCLSLFGAYFVSMLLEIPFAGLDKFIFKR